MAKEDVLFQEWLEETAAAFEDPADKAAFEAFAQKPAGKNVFKGHLRENRFHQKMSEVDQKEKQLEAEHFNLTQKASELDVWYKENLPVTQRLKDDKSELTRQLEAARSELAELGLDVRGHERKGAVSEDLEKRWKDAEARNAALEARVIAMDTNFPIILGEFLDVSHKANKENYDVSPRDIMNYTMKKRVDPQTAFNELTATEREKREEAKFAKAIEKAKEEGRREALKSTVHSPDRLRPALPFFQTLKPAVADDKDARASEAIAIFMDQAD